MDRSDPEQAAFDFSYQPLSRVPHRSGSFDIGNPRAQQTGARCFTRPSLDHCKFMLYMTYQLTITIIYTQVERRFRFHESHYLTTAEWIDQMLVFFLFLVWHLYRVADHRLHLRSWKTGCLFLTTHSTTMFVWGYASQVRYFQTDLTRMRTWSAQMWAIGISVFIGIIAVFSVRMREIIRDRATVTYHSTALALLTPIFVVFISYILSSKVHIHHWWLFWWLSFFFGNSSSLCMLVATSSTMGVFSQSASTYIFGQLL